MGDVALTIRVQGSQEVLGQLKAIGATSQEAMVKTAQAAAQVKQPMEQVAGSVTGARTAVSAFSGALSNATLILRLTGQENTTLAQILGTVSFVMVTATVAVQAWRGALAGLPLIIGAVRGAIAALTVSMATLTAVLAPIVLVVAALAVAYVLLTRDTEATKEVTERAARATWDAQRAMQSAAASSAFLAGSIVTLTDGLVNYAIALRRVGQGLITFGLQQDEATQRAAKAAAAEAVAQAKLADQLRETRIQREMDEVVRNTIAERAFATAQSLVRQAAFMAAEAVDIMAPVFEKVSTELVAQFTVISDFIRTRIKGDADAARDERLAQLAFELEIGQKALADKIALLEEELKATDLTVQQRRALELDLFRTRQQIAAMAKTALDEEAQFRIQTAERVAEANKDAAIASLNAWLEALIAQKGMTDEVLGVIRRVNEAISRIATGTSIQVISTWQQAWDAIRQSFAQGIGQLAVGLGSISEIANAVWNQVKTSFASMIADMVTRWLTGHTLMAAISKAWAVVEVAFAKAVAWAKALAAHAGIPFIGLILGIAAALAIIAKITQGAFQRGADMVVSRPTLIKVGETSERVTVRPISGSRDEGTRSFGAFLQPVMASGGGGPTIILSGPTILDEISAWRLARIVGDELRRQERRQIPMFDRPYRGREAAASVNGGWDGVTGVTRTRR